MYRKLTEFLVVLFDGKNYVGDVGHSLFLHGGNIHFSRFNCCSCSFPRAHPLQGNLDYILKLIVFDQLGDSSDINFIAWAPESVSKYKITYYYVI